MQGGCLYPWHSAHVISTLVVGIVFRVAFVLYGKPDETLPPRVSSRLMSPQERT